LNPLGHGPPAAEGNQGCLNRAIRDGGEPGRNWPGSRKLQVGSMGPPSPGAGGWFLVFAARTAGVREFRRRPPRVGVSGKTGRTPFPEPDLRHVRPPSPEFRAPQPPESTTRRPFVMVIELLGDSLSHRRLHRRPDQGVLPGALPPMVGVCIHGDRSGAARPAPSGGDTYMGLAAQVRTPGEDPRPRRSWCFQDLDDPPVGPANLRRDHGRRRTRRFGCGRAGDEAAAGRRTSTRVEPLEVSRASPAARSRRHGVHADRRVERTGAGSAGVLDFTRGDLAPRRPGTGSPRPRLNWPDWWQRGAPGFMDAEEGDPRLPEGGESDRARIPRRAPGTSASGGWVGARRAAAGPRTKR